MPFLGLQRAPAASRCGPLLHVVGHTVVYLQAYVDAEGTRKFLSKWGADFFPTPALNTSWLANDVYLRRAAESTASAETSGVGAEKCEAAAAEGSAKVPGWEVLDGEGDSSLSRSSTTDKESPAAQDAARPKQSASIKKNKNKAAKEVKSRGKSRHDGGALLGGSKKGTNESRLARKSKIATAGKGSKAKRKTKVTSEPTLRYRRHRRI